MRLQSSFSLLSTSVIASVAAQGVPTGELGNATAVENNPPGVVYVATLPAEAAFKPAYPDGGNVKGSINAVASPNGMGVIFKVKFENLPSEGGPFSKTMYHYDLETHANKSSVYHIHDAPVPADGNCTKTLAHLDPFIRGEDPPCDSALPETCQVGDLSGKHGKITSDPFSATYTDEFASTLPGIGAFFGNRSFVIHFANKTRISCANFQAVTTNNPTPTDNCTSTPTPTPFSTGVVPTYQPTSTFVTVSGAMANNPVTVFMVGAASFFVAMTFML
ncbi:putative cytosolic cu zn superoxide dismutase protein [Phaeoacremonium minimum UCRPA7]|uniref:superoxide dismutase n=1 Tax=Phaeoacremonium minimum (strain UCR-PA7) TaxID=1286976 RepID=R8BF37_PHAM7|nr:putative cytosolic cu zn superoxide dismutase protein [Phaeoacremonium minimum UCRPA7]EON97915.1 putative cytosolic cu zn superoxide dismutase protein [Phaeoacremonium minimum UCRPA7]